MANKTKLSERVRPDIEAAPWVVDEIKKLENHNNDLEQSLRVVRDSEIINRMVNTELKKQLNQLKEQKLIEEQTEINFETLKDAYDFTLDINGEVQGLVSGDMGWQPTGIKIDEESLKIWLIGVEENDKAYEKPRELTPEEKEDNQSAYWRGENEGWGYAVMYYTDGKEFIDSKTRELWKAAGDSLDELEVYLKQFKDEEI